MEKGSVGHEPVQVLVGAGYVIFQGSLEILDFKGAAASDQVADGSFQVVNRYEVVKGVPVFHAPQG